MCQTQIGLGLTQIIQKMNNNYNKTEFKKLLEEKFGKVSESREYKLVSGKSRKVLDFVYLDKNKDIVGVLEIKNNTSFIEGKNQLQIYSNEVLKDKGFAGLLLEDKLFVFEKDGFSFNEVKEKGEVSKIFWKGANLLRGRYKTTEGIKIILSLLALKKYDYLEFKSLLELNEKDRLEYLFDRFKQMLRIENFIDFQSLNIHEIRELLYFVSEIDLNHITYENILELFKHDKFNAELYVPKEIQENLFKDLNNKDKILVDFMQNKILNNSTYTTLNYNIANFRKLINYICDTKNEDILVGDYILSPDNRKYDFIVSCPPFNLRRENQDYAYVQDNEFSGVKTKEYIVYYLGKLLHQLASGGTLKIVIPNGFYFKSGILSEIRKQLKYRFEILSIDTYDGGIYYPLTNIGVSVLTIKKQEPNNKSKTIFRKYNVEKQRREILGIKLDKEFSINQIDLEDMWTFDLYLQKSFSDGNLPLSNKKYPMITLKEILLEHRVGRQIETSAEGDGFYLKGENLKKNYINYKDAGRLDFDDKIASKSIIKLGDVLFSRVGRNHKFAVNSKNNVCVNQNVMILTPNKTKVLPEFLAVLLNLYNDEGLLQPLHSGTAISMLNTNAFMDLKVYLPSIEEQKVIVEKFKKYEKMLHDKKNLTTEFLNLIYTFETDVKNKVQISDVCDLINPKRVSIKDFSKEGKYPVISSKYFKDGIVEGFEDMTNEKVNLYHEKDSIVLINTFLDSLNAAIVRNNKEYVMGNRLYGFKTNENLNKYYLLALFLCDQLKDELEKTLTGNYRPSINFTKLKEIKIPMLPIEKQKEFEKIFLSYHENKSKINMFWNEIENEVRAFYE